MKTHKVRRFFIILFLILLAIRILFEIFWVIPTKIIDKRVGNPYEDYNLTEYITNREIKEKFNDYPEEKLEKRKYRKMNYPIFADSSDEYYLATILGTKFKSHKPEHYSVDMESFSNLKDLDYFEDVLKKVIIQNPYCVSVSLDRERKELLSFFKDIPMSLDVYYPPYSLEGYEYDRAEFYNSFEFQETQKEINEKISKLGDVDIKYFISTDKKYTFNKYEEIYAFNKEVQGQKMYYDKEKLMASVDGKGYSSLANSQVYKIWNTDDEVRVISGTLDGEIYFWNIVKENDYWYFVDVSRGIDRMSLKDLEEEGYKITNDFEVDSEIRNYKFLEE